MAPPSEASVSVNKVVACHAQRCRWCGDAGLADAPGATGGRAARRADREARTNVETIIGRSAPMNGLITGSKQVYDLRCSCVGGGQIGTAVAESSGRHPFLDST